MNAPERLVRVLLREGIRDQRLLEAFRRIPRAGFVPGESVDRAYFDEPIPIPHGQVTTQPSLVARMIEALSLQGGERVLEVGTGYGFQTALLARMAGFVWSIERFPDLAEAARRHLAGQAIENVEVVVGDGTKGLPERAPFEAILVSAAAWRVPAPLAQQLAPGGRLVQPIGPGGRERVTLFLKRAGRLEPQEVLVGAHFVPLAGELGLPEA